MPWAGDRDWPKPVSIRPGQKDRVEIPSAPDRTFPQVLIGLAEDPLPVVKPSVPWERGGGSVSVSTISLFQVERIGFTVIVTPNRGGVGRNSFEQSHEDECRRITEPLDSKQAKNVLIDCRNVDLCCSLAVAFFFRLWKRTWALGGRMAFCNASEHLEQELKSFGLDKTSTFFTSRSEAIAELEP